ncbi:winged helix-turn-helix domain-containing protein [Sphingomonas alba]|uniref:Winged helix-turn-helix domain-containing protein n=1 Tax=Sphingomonas alba TaxID=2908208 RepID=A0ABT0RKR9_9SPHN|nr:winged helix-turn-helix domain-containing protein [Sphingomonas alba]MCL6683200.1 winged helix-turn-helix domain-containing protein [Sphingomonas alba]
MSSAIRFSEFELDPANRQLRRGSENVELNGRYFDALALMVGEPGRLVTKDRFMDEVWRGVPVTDEALTQCIRTLRRQLGDDASRPRFIETVPKHGYRFIAPLAGSPARRTPDPAIEREWAEFRRLGFAGVKGAVAAGMIGGLFYGFTASQAGGSAISMLLVMLVLTVAIALVGGAGVSFGIAASEFSRRHRWYWPIVGGAIGGALVGAIVHLLGLDGFNLLFGRSPGDMTGAPEGLLIGSVTGLGYVLGGRQAQLRVGAPLAAFLGGIAGVVIALTGGQMLGGSLDLLAQHFPGSQLHLTGLFGEAGFGPASQTVTAALEGFLFSGCVVCGMLLAKRATKD